MRTVATAGHVDHGKSSLVLALTGTDPDRFAEEKERGLTIDLGFAFTTLPSGTEVGFVDVPGHVRFIKNMLAGVGAVDVALLVVAATEGWMPQSEEHTRILELLGVDHGMVAITKADLADDEMLELAQLEIDERLASTPLAGAPIVLCDSLSRRGIEEIRSTLDDVLAATPAARDTGRPRLWIDRVFAAKGAGTVVTGTLTGGSIAVDDELDAGPHRVRVRGIETAGLRLDRAAPGTRVAFNLSGVEHRDLARGDAVVRAGQWPAVALVDVALHPIPGEKLKRRGRLAAYVGSGEHRVWLRALDDGSTFGRLRFDDPLPLAPGDHVVLRDPGARRTVAGAVILDVTPTSRAPEAADRLARPLGERLLAAHPWTTPSDVARFGGLSAEDASTLVGDLVDSGFASLIGEWVVDTDVMARVRENATARVVAHHRDHPHEAGLDVTALAASLGIEPEQLRAAVDGAPDVVVERGVVRHSSHVGRLSDTPEARRLLDAYAASPFAPPSDKELGADVKLVRALVREGVLVDADGVVFAASALEQARSVVIDALRERGKLSVADVRDVLGSTRKFVVPIVGWLDRQGVTRRRGDDRVPGPASGIAEG